LAGAPVAESAIVGGTIKALAVRFLVPLYLTLGALALWQEGWGFTLRLAPCALLAALFVLRRLYPVCVSDRPLSIAPDELRADLDWFGVLGGMSFVLVALAIVANRFATSPTASAALFGALLSIEILGERRLRR
jgi:hypothetical protein